MKIYFVQNDEEDKRVLLIMGLSIFFGLIMIELGVVDWIAANWVWSMIGTTILMMIILIIKEYRYLMQEFDRMILTHLDQPHPDSVVLIDEI